MANLIHHAIHPGIGLTEDRVMAIAGLTVFYAGKQILYFAKFPFLRVNILVNSALTFALCVAALFFTDTAWMLAGLTIALLFHVGINSMTTIRKVRAFDALGTREREKRS